MCHEYYWRRRDEEAEESRRVWMDFERSRPVAEPEPVAAEPEVEPQAVDAEVAAPAGR